MFDSIVTLDAAGSILNLCVRGGFILGGVGLTSWTSAVSISDIGKFFCS